MSERERPRPPRVLTSFLPIILSVLFLPLILMVLSSFSDSGKLSLKWYDEVSRDPLLWMALERSFLVAVGSAAVATFLGVLGALALDKWKFRARIMLVTLSSLSLMLPELVLSLSLLCWFAVLNIPLSLATVIGAHVTLVLPFVILIIQARLKALDPAFDDAARDLGAGEWQVLFHVTLPLLKPSILTSFLLAFLISFDDFLVTYYTNGAGSDTLPVRLYSMMKTGMSPKVQALSSIMLIASVLFIALFVRLRAVRDLTRA